MVQWALLFLGLYYVSISRQQVCQTSFWTPEKFQTKVRESLQFFLSNLWGFQEESHKSSWVLLQTRELPTLHM